MSIKKALLIGFTTALIFMIATWLIGHLWVFIILVATALIGIAMTTNVKGKGCREDKTSCKKDTTESGSPTDEQA